MQTLRHPSPTELWNLHFKRTPGDSSAPGGLRSDALQQLVFYLCMCRVSSLPYCGTWEGIVGTW